MMDAYLKKKLNEFVEAAYGSGADDKQVVAILRIAASEIENATKTIPTYGRVKKICAPLSSVTI